MTLDKMWAALEAHQNIADRLGYGHAWGLMCMKKDTPYAFYARKASFNENIIAGLAAKKAMFAISNSKNCCHETAQKFADQAITLIEKANKEFA